MATVDRYAWIPVAAAIAAAVLPPATRAEDQAAASIAAIADLLDSEQAPAKSEPIAVQGIVTLAYGDNFAFAIQDESGGVWATTFHLPKDSKVRAIRAGLKAGDLVAVDGRLDRGAYAPIIFVDNIRIAGQASLPKPLAADLPRLFRGADNCRRVAIEGVVRAIRSDGRYDGLVLDVDSRQIVARFPRDMPPSAVAGLVDATVRVVGVTGALRNVRGEFLCPLLAIGGPADIAVVTAAPATPFEARLVPADRIAQFSGEPIPRHRIRTAGTVSTVLSSKVLFLQARARGLRVELSEAGDIRPGDIVEVAGFVDMSRQIAGLSEAAVRRTGRTQAPDPQPIRPNEIASINERARGHSQAATPGDFDGCLVTFDARVMELKPAASGGHLILSTDDTTLMASLADPSFGELMEIQPGSDVRVTGVIQLTLLGDQGLRSVVTNPIMHEMSLLLRSPDDVTLVRSPSWWTPARLAALLGAVLAGLAVALVWVALLRREVRSTTLRLADEMRSRRNAAIDFQATLRERNRLAANLHDTLLQTLRGIDFQLGACEARGDEHTSAPWEHIDVARKMVNHAAEELRGSVWALRTMPMAGKSLGESLDAIARQTGHGHAEHIAVRTSGSAFEVPQFVAGNLLLVAQEAIHNALAHADAGQIDVEAAFDAVAGTVELTIVDDGRGFAQGAESGPDQGHFGLTGMRERIERLGGRFTIESRPGAGTSVRAKVRTLDYDSRIEVADAEGAVGAAVSVGTRD